ncbi:unnamed protein product [Paramecium primaurelia]|uniref:LITAF domain-containing protein n=1 Tax=Paramecium primaurelia TaxID=5886 RepID=A0A8S1L1N6_PARPR|nr:unnamed protein product [Paramecium primaurelia]
MIESEVYEKDCRLNIKCPHCEKDIKTNLEHECGVNTWLMCFFLCVLTALEQKSLKCADIVF